VLSGRDVDDGLFALGDVVGAEPDPLVDREASCMG